MSTSAVVERRNNQIQDAIDGHNFKQALQLCEKRLKKGEDTHHLRAWKAHILYRHADEAHRQRGIKETLELCRLEPPVTDVAALDILQDTLRSLGEHADAARAIWERAAKAKAQDQELQSRWFQLACDAGDWKSAQKAAMGLQNNFPKIRKYYFWAIFMCYLVSIDAASSETDRKLFGTLAYRMISKAASSVPTDAKELLSPPRAIQSQEELFLLLKIFESQNRHDEIIKTLDSENVGIKSRIGQNDWNFTRGKLTGLEQTGLWQDAVAFTRDLLALPETEGVPADIQEKDDWTVWKLLLTATEKLNDAETLNKTHEFVQTFSKRLPKSRNAQLALLELTQLSISAGSRPESDLLSACKTYFDSNSTKLHCFKDLQKFLLKLDSDNQSSFFSHVSQNVETSRTEGKGTFKDVPEINALKFEYCFRLSFGGDETSKKQAEDFVVRCLQAFNREPRPDANTSDSKIESQPIDDLCLLAVMALIRSSETDAKAVTPSSVLIQAAAILELLLLKSPHNYEALLLLTRIYLLLGAGSLALKAYAKLSVKQMQFETVAHNLFTRLSTIHPHSAPPIEGAEYKDFEPRAAFQQALNFYRNAEVSTTYARTKGLEHGSYVNVEGTIELQKNLQNSICKKMSVLEMRRLQRLIGGESTGRWDSFVSDKNALVDKRNFDGFPNCELPGQSSFEEHLRLGPLPRENWINEKVRTDKLFTFLEHYAQARNSPEHDHFGFFESTELLQSPEFTSAEITSANVFGLIVRATYVLLGQPQAGDNDVNELVSLIEKWLQERSTELTPSPSTSSPAFDKNTISLGSIGLAPSWEYLHANYSTVEVLKAISLFASFAQSLPKAKSAEATLRKEKIASVKSLVKAVADAVKLNTRFLKSGLSESGVLGRIIDIVVEREGEGQAGVGKEVEAVVDSVQIETFAGELMESWEEGLEGLVGVQVK